MNWAGLPRFRGGGTDEAVEFAGTGQVTEGVICHVYRFAGDDSRDLGIIEVSPGCGTPVQRVAGGDETAEGWLAGAGTLTVITAAGTVTEHGYPGAGPGPVVVSRGDSMFWEAGPAGLVFYEICAPPYAPGRFAGLFRQHL